MSQPIFDKSIHLSELHIQRNGDSFFLFGEALAVFNTGGYYFYPDLTKSISFDNKSGNWVICEVDNKHQGELDPEVASWQFRETMAEEGLEIMRGILGGYVRKAYQVIDPVYPGFTDTLLKHLVAKPVLSATRPREIRLNFGRVLANYGLAVDFNQDFSKPVLIPIPPTTDPPLDLALLLAIIVIVLADMDVSQWIKQVEDMGNNGEMAQILGAISRREHISTWDGMVAKILGLDKAKRRLNKIISTQPIPNMVLLLVIRGIYAEEKVITGGMWGVPFNIFKIALAEMLPQEPIERIECLEALMDGMDNLARVADEQGKISTSIRFAQNTKILMQMVLWDQTNVGGTEERISYDEVQEKQYSWHDFTSANATNKMDYYNYLTYTNSASSADLHFFALSCQLFAQKQATNYLWTAIWRALHRQRKALKITLEVINQVNTHDADDIKNFTMVFENNIKAYLKCLKDFGGAIGSTVVPGEPTSNYFHLFTGDEEEDQKMFLNRDTEIGIRLYETLKANGLDHSTQATLSELVTSFDNRE